MPKKQAPLNALQQYIPDEALQLVLHYLQAYKVHLTITKERRTVLGDYRHAIAGQNHRISINSNLNKYAFLITLVHELAHLVTFLEFGNKVASHGKEWKQLYRDLLLQFLVLKIFPADVQDSLQNSLHNLPASSCADENLMRVLKKYDVKQNGLLMIEQLTDGALFEIDGGRVFKRGKKLRKRFQCLEIATLKVYLFSAVYEVKQIAV